MTLGCPKGPPSQAGLCVRHEAEASEASGSECVRRGGAKGPAMGPFQTLSQAWKHGEATSRASRALLLNQRGQMCSSDEVFDGRCVSPNSELTALLLTLWSTVGELPGTDHCARRRTSQDDYCVSTCIITLR